MYARTHSSTPGQTQQPIRPGGSPHRVTALEVNFSPVPRPPLQKRSAERTTTRRSAMVVLRGLERSKVRAAALTAALSWAPFALGKEEFRRAAAGVRGRHVEPETHWNKWRCLFVYITCQLFSLSSGFPAALGKVGRGGAWLSVPMVVDLGLLHCDRIGMHNSSVSSFSYVAYFVQRHWVQTLGTGAGRDITTPTETGQALPYIHVNDKESSRTKRTITLMTGLDM